MVAKSCTAKQTPVTLAPHPSGMPDKICWGYRKKTLFCLSKLIQETAKNTPQDHVTKRYDYRPLANFGRMKPPYCPSAFSIQDTRHQIVPENSLQGQQAKLARVLLTDIAVNQTQAQTVIDIVSMPIRSHRPLASRAPVSGFSS